MPRALSHSCRCGLTPDGRGRALQGGVTVASTGVDSDLWGVLGAHSHTRRAYSADDVNFLELVANVLEAHGVGVTGSDGINMWMSVADERSALVTLAAQGIGAAPGEPFQVRDDSPHLRVTVGLIESDHERIAGQLAAAAGGSRSPRGHR